MTNAATPFKMPRYWIPNTTWYRKRATRQLRPMLAIPKKDRNTRGGERESREESQIFFRRHVPKAGSDMLGHRLNTHRLHKTTATTALLQTSKKSKARDGFFSSSFKSPISPSVLVCVYILSFSLQCSKTLPHLYKFPFTRLRKSQQRLQTSGHARGTLGTPHHLMKYREACGGHVPEQEARM